MSDQPIQIEVQDKVAPSILTKLGEIATVANVGHTHVERLKKALASIDGSAINALSMAQTRAQKAMNDSAIAAQRLARETANAAAAQTRAQSAALRLQQQQERLAASTNKAAREGEALKRELFPLYAAHQQYNEAVDRANHLHRQGAIDMQTYNAALSMAKLRLEGAAVAARTFNAAQVATGRVAQLNRMHLTNLGFQLNDIGLSLASGQNPLIVMIQQGSQIAGIASQAGVGIGRLAVEAFNMTKRFIPLVAVVGAVLSGFKLLASEASEGAKLDEFARSLGATDKQIKELSLGVVTLGDTIRGLFKTIDDATGLSLIFADLWAHTKEVFTAILKFIANTFNSVISLGRATIETLVVAWDVLPNRLGLIIANAVNSGIEMFDRLVNGVIDGVNTIITAFNALNGTSIALLENIAFEQIDTSKFEALGTDLSQVFVNAYTQNMESNQAAIDGFLAKWQANAVAAARNRIANELGDDKTILNRAAALAKVNAELDNEIQRMFLLRPEREAQARFDQIEEQMIGKKITLTSQEAAAIRAKINAIEAAKVSQQQFDRIYEESVEPLRTYTATLLASQKLIAMNAEFQEAATRSIIKAQEAYLNSLDPLRQVNKEIDQQNQLLAMLPRQREAEQTLQQITNQLLTQGIVLTNEQTDALRQRLAAQVELNVASQAEAQIWESTRGAREQYIAQLEAINKLRAGGTITGGEAAQAIINASPELDFVNTQTEMDARVTQFADMYQKVDDLRKQDLINERTAAALRMRIWAEQQAANVATASDFFGQLSQLQKSENSKIARIGKAAAISKAIIDTYTAATGAYASLASIPFVGPALGAAAAAGAIAAGMANVQAIRSEGTGFQQGGYTGNGAVDAVAGAVHGREFVMDANATSRIGVANLESLRRGASGVQGVGNAAGQTIVTPPAQVNQKIINVLDPAIVGQYLASGEGEEVILNVIERNPQRVGASVNGA